MLTFDKLKIITPIDTIQVTDESQFSKVVKDGRLLYLNYAAERPSLLKIKIDRNKSEAAIEFTGKILGTHYPQLISYQNIRECFDNINRKGFCWIDTEAIMESKVVKADVTQDIRCGDIAYLTSYIHAHLRNHQRYTCRILRNRNAIIEKNVVTGQHKMRLTVYDKGREMAKAENLQFMTLHNIPRNTFDGLCRFELNLTSQTKIKEALSIKQTSLRKVLYSLATPLRSFVDSLLAESGEMPITDKKSFIAAAVLSYCDNDLEKIESIMRLLHPSRGCNIKKIMEPYREVHDRQLYGNRRNFKQELLDLLA